MAKQTPSDSVNPKALQEHQAEEAFRTRVTLFRKAFRPVRKEPPHFQLIGTGVVLLSSLSVRALPAYRVTMLWLTVLFVPLIPLRAYAEFGGRIVGSLSVLAAKRLFGWWLAWYYVKVWFRSILRSAFLLILAGGLVLGWWYLRGSI